MPPVGLLQYNSGWQSQPSILPGPFKEPSSVNVKRHSTPAINVAKSRATTVIVESTTSLAATKEPQATPETKQENNEESVMQDPGLRQLIISRIRNGGDGPEVEVFSNVTEDDYVYVLDAIGCDDKLIRKPSYIPSLHQIVATLPSPIHESILVPLRTAMGIIVESLDIPDNFEVSLPIHMGRMVDAPATAELPSPQDETQGYHLGVPDLVLMFQTRDDDIRPFWPFEVSVSQTAEGAIAKLQKFGDRNEHVLAATHINIAESRKHASPTYEWGVAKKLNRRGVQMGELTRSEDGALASHSHTWYHPATVTITTWIRPPNRRLNLNSRHRAYCASAVLYPNQNEQALAKVQNIFQRTLEQVRDTVVDHLEAEHADDDTLLSIVSSDSLQAMRDWSPPRELLDWNKCSKDLRSAMKQTGFNRYRAWHRSFLKRVADEAEVSV
ncbi:uncharacterized protein F5891DRAFT_1239070 [Suillus fuscotomentosus]|uniref:Uncharacterized protein n=1 Tax=Suillus fuscotomentosus TaxID=1912939 RepID=A0AAD4HJ08_9AGAM|nr:uncharacterized protein F5891DRAFT_1239070 [Suillus fuscotomentosus]KAG1898302.1 hypothetical protein F5891DRAFT_1239070 [Suillus fuscotomentosus]